MPNEEFFSKENAKKLIEHVITLMARIDKLEPAVSKTHAQSRETAKALKMLADIVAERTSAPATTPEAEGPSQSQDKTPFPAGVSATGPIAGATLDQTVAAAAQAKAEEVPAADVGSSQAMNASPIPNRPGKKNGAKEASS